MPRIAIGPDTCGLQLTHAGLRELRRRRGLGTWYYEPVFRTMAPLAVRRWVLVPRDSEELPEHSHAVPYGEDLGAEATPAAAERGPRLYGCRETEDRTDPDLLDMAERPDGPWFQTRVKVVDVPDGVDWYLFEDEDGSESIHEKHRTWS